MDATYRWTITSGEWFDSSWGDSLKEVVDSLARLSRIRLTSPSFALNLSCRWDDDVITIWTYYNRKAGCYKAIGNKKDNCSQNWLIYEINKLLKPT